MDEDAPEEAPAETTEADETAALDDSAVSDFDKTLFRNLYIPSFNIPEEKEESKDETDIPKEYSYEIPYDDPRALKYCDTTRVGWKSRVDYAVNAYRTQRLKAKATEYDIHRDPTALLNVTITTVILLASGIYDIPMEYYLYTELYLLSIRDEFNDSPPNIENLIKHIRFIRKNNNIQWQVQAMEEPPPGVVISKIPNKSRIPLPLNSSRRRSVSKSADKTDEPKEEAPAEEAPAEE